MPFLMFSIYFSSEEFALNESESSSHPGHRASVKMASTGVNTSTRRRVYVVGVGMTKVTVCNNCSFALPLSF